MPSQIRINRTQILAILILVIMAIFVVRLFYMQVLRHDYYQLQANSEQIKSLVLPAVRGEIYALDGKEPVKIALNETVYTVWADPQSVEEADRTKLIETIKRIAGGEIVSNPSERLAKTETRYQILARKITSKQAQLIKNEKIYGVGFERGERRVYPEGQLASQVLGFVNNDGLGQYGVEGKLNQQLNGKDGLLKTVKDFRDVPLTIGRDNVNIPAEDGRNVVLTIDRNIQNHAEQALAKGIKEVGAEYGSMLVMQPSSGKVLAMANVPTYDPSNYGKVDLELLNNRIVSRPYEPASVIKTLTMSTGIDKGVMNPNSTYINTDKKTIGDFTINNASKGQTGEVTMQRVLNWSLNTGTVTMAEWLGDGSINNKAREAMYEYFHDRFKLGEASGIELSGEAKGTVIAPTEQEGNAIRYANMTFGQGLDVTPLQVSAAFNAVVNGGKYCPPTIIAGDIKDSKFKAASPKTCSQAIQPQTSATMRDMTQKARAAFYGSNDRKGYQIGGKTGTAQTIENGKYVFSTTEGTYIGYGASPEKMPAYTILVTYYRKGREIGGEKAAPTFTDMSNWMIDYLKLEPKR